MSKTTLKEVCFYQIITTRTFSGYFYRFLNVTKKKNIELCLFYEERILCLFGFHWFAALSQTLFFFYCVFLLKKKEVSPAVDSLWSTHRWF